MQADGVGRRVVVLALAAILLAVSVTDTEFYLEGVEYYSYQSIHAIWHALLFGLALNELFSNSHSSSELWDASLILSILSVMRQVVYFRTNTVDGLLYALEAFLLSASVVIFSSGAHKALFAHVFVGAFFRNRYYYGPHVDKYHPFSKEEVYISSSLHFLTAALVIALYFLSTPLPSTISPVAKKIASTPHASATLTNALPPQGPPAVFFEAETVNTPAASSSASATTTSIPNNGGGDDASNAASAAGNVSKGENKKKSAHARARSVEPPAPPALKSNSFFANAPEKEV